MGRPGVWQLVILLLIIVLLFGARRLPDLARSVGESLKIFKSSVKDGDAREPQDRAPQDGGPGPVGERTDPSRASVEGAPRPSSEASPDPTPPSDGAPPRPDGERGPHA